MIRVLVMRIGSAILILLFVAAAANAQRPAPWSDDLAGHLAGTWKAEGDVGGHPAHHLVTAQWVLNHQFLQITEKTDPNASATESRYDAVWFLGYDDVSDRYVLHLLDVFGGRLSRLSDTERVTATMPDSCSNIRTVPFTIAGGGYRSRRPGNGILEQKDKAGKWKTFGDFKLTPAPTS